MYQIRCGDYILYDPREESLSLLEPKCSLKANSVGEGSFTILPNHPYYDKLVKLKSIFEIWEGNDIIFRGRMINGFLDFDKQLSVDLEGILGVTNDTIIPPFNFPDDFKDAADADNVVEHFLQWILDCHNEHVSDWQKLNLGRVTVADPNNYITRSSEDYASTWETLRTKLFDSSLGGYLCIRYEADGNYVDYLDKFTSTNTQEITFGENLLDITNQTDATATYSAILPIGADGLTIKDLPDGELSDDYVKKGLYIYSKSAVEAYGWICMPVEETTWDDVNYASILQTKGKETLSSYGITMASTITAKACDLHFTDSEIQAIRIYQNILVNSKPHGVVGVTYPLTELDIDIKNPQSTVITIGDTRQTLIDRQHTNVTNTAIKFEDIDKHINDMTDKLNNIEGLFFYIRYSANADGSEMTEEPQNDTVYMGTCSTSANEAPTDPAKYTWCKIVGADGASGANGVGIASIVEQYYYSTSATTLSGGTWSEVVPNRDDSKYLWTRSVITYTDKSALVTNAVCVTGSKGADGEDGADGTDGADGKSAYEIAVENGFDGGQEDWLESLVGKDGADGIQGPAGEDGKTQYLHIAYGTSTSGANFSVTYFDTATHIGTCVDYTSSDPTTASSYTWALIKGKDGADGTDGKDGTNGKDGADGADGEDGNGVSEVDTEFYLSTSKTSLTGGSWVTDQPSWSTGKYLWIRNKVTYTNGNTAYTTPYCDTTWEAVNDLNSALNKEAIFNRLTDNGTVQGIYMDGDDYYFNASYIKTGTLSADRIDVDALMAKDLKATGSFQVDNGAWKLVQDTSGTTIQTTAAVSGVPSAYVKIGSSLVNINAINPTTGEASYLRLDHNGSDGDVNATLGNDSASVNVNDGTVTLMGDALKGFRWDNDSAENIVLEGDVPNLSYALGYLSTAIPSGADLDSYTTAGCYKVTSNTIAAKVTNIPYQYAGKLVVENILGAVNASSSTWKYIMQTYYPMSHKYGRIARRMACTNSTTSTWEFGLWYDLLDSATLVVERGSATIPYYNGAASDVYVRFNKTFSSAPTVIVSQVFNDANIVVLEEDIDEMGFTARLGAMFTSEGKRTFRWVAIESN